MTSAGEEGRADGARSREHPEAGGLTEWNARVHRFKGVGSWRGLYLWFLRDLTPGSVAEFGSGDPSFLALVDGGVRRTALDGNEALAGRYAAAGIEFHAVDFARWNPSPELSNFDVAVCSDVFEHLVFPERLLEVISRCLAPDGILFSHVPNEFQLRRTLRILRGRRVSVYHHDAHEWNDPHLRRFTDLGYERFLATRFPFNLKITDLRYRGWARTLSRLGLRVPFCLEGGPTYASTASESRYRRLLAIKKALARDKAFLACRGGAEGLFPPQDAAAPETEAPG